MEEKDVMDETVLEVSDALQQMIDKEIEKLKKENPTAKGIFAIAVKGDEDYGEKSEYVAYFKRAGSATFTKYMAALSKDNTYAGAKMLAKETFIGGDRELIDDDDLFIYGVFPRIHEATKVRQGAFVNLSRPRK